MPIADFKALVREQFYILLIDEKAALAAIPSMLPPDVETREKAFGLINQVLSSRGEFSAEDKKRMDEVSRLFGLEGGARGRIFARFRKNQGKKPPDAEFAKGLVGSTTKSNEITAIRPGTHPPKYERLIPRAKQVPAVSTIVVHPCDDNPCNPLRRTCSLVEMLGDSISDPHRNLYPVSGRAKAAHPQGVRRQRLLLIALARCRKPSARSDRD